MLGPIAATRSEGRLPYARCHRLHGEARDALHCPPPPAVNEGQRSMQGVVDQDRGTVGIPQNERHILMVRDQRIITGANLPAIVSVDSPHVGCVTLVWADHTGPPDSERVAYPIQVLIHRRRVVAEPSAQI